MYVYCAYMYSLYLCVHCFSVYRYVYSCVCSFLCAVVTLGRGALYSLATFTACFLIKTFIHAYLLPFPFCLSCDPCIHAYLLPYLLPYVCQNGSKVHSIRFLELFKRFNCVSHTFVPFVLFCVLIESYFRLFCRF